MADSLFKDILTNLSNVAADLSSLEVMTFTGNVNEALDATGNFNWGTVISSAKTTGNIKLVACTRLEFDGDAKTFQSNEKLDRFDDLLKLHNDTVALGMQTRSAILNLIGDSVKGIIGRK